MDVVTGAFSFTGKYVAERLIENGRRVRTLTNHPDRESPFTDEIHAEPYRFDDPGGLAASLEGAETLYNTFWIRDPHEGPPPGNAVRFSGRLVEAAETAGVDRIVHFSVSNADASDLAYYRAKARVERIVEAAGMSHAILRPTLVYGVDDMLVNNLAWALRRLPVFAVHGDGSYRVQPVFVGDVADIAVEQGRANANVRLDLAGPDVLAFTDFLRLLRDHLGARCALVHAPPRIAHVGVRLAEVMLRDRILSWEEAQGLLANLLVTGSEPEGETRLDDWLGDHADELGTEYTSYRQRYESENT